MWELLVNGATLNVGDRLRYRIIYRDEELVNEVKIIMVGQYYFFVLTTKIGDVEIVEQDQQTIKYSLSDLNRLGLERWIA
ncbi:MAG: hypothetical protein ACI7YS_16185 [Flavobacterium sp.]